MYFFTPYKQPRPVRLSDATRQFAYDSQNCRYGIDTLKVPNVSLGHIEGFDSLSPIEKYNRSIYEIVTKAPIRICDGELISGAATLGDATFHQLPAIYSDEKRGYDTGTSHLTPDYTTVLKEGMDSIRDKAMKALSTHVEPGKKEFIKSCIHCIDCMKIWHQRYIDELAKRDGYTDNVRNLNNVPFKPAASFYEAVQSIWFCFAYMKLTGCWPGIGRIDVMLGDYLRADLEKGIVTIDRAREILAHFFIKGCEWITGSESLSGGDAQHYQNIVLSGSDMAGNDVTNEITYLVLDIIEETGISDFPVTVRIHPGTPEKLYERIAQVMCHGGGIIAIYNESLIIDSLKDMDYPKEEIYNFANDGCWEVQIPGKTNFGYIPFDSLRLLQHVTLSDYNGTAKFSSFEELMEKYKNDISDQVKAIYEEHVASKFSDSDFTYNPDHPCTVISLFVGDCIERGLSYKEGGAKYRVISPHIGGLPDAVNSLYAIKKAVFDDRLISFDDFMKILKNNWSNQEKLKLEINNRYKYFGNDNDEVDLIAADILGYFSDMCREYDKKTPIRFVTGVSTFGRQIEWAPARSAAPFGRKKGEILSGNMSPTPGTDSGEATAIIKSYCKADLKKQHTGAALDLSLDRSIINSGAAVPAIIGMIKAFCELGGYFMQIDIQDIETLIDAREHPENHRSLTVRVSGWSARFVTMGREWQDMIIERTKK